MDQRQMWYQRHHASWLQLVAILQTEGWEAQLTCTAAPVQVEGRLPSGERFYFRARHDEITLGIGGDGPADAPEWEAAEPHPEASWLPAPDGEAAIRRLALRYTARGEPST